MAEQRGIRAWLLLELLPLGVGHPQRTEDDDHHDAHQKLVEGQPFIEPWATAHLDPARTPAKQVYGEGAKSGSPPGLFAVLLQAAL
jgi:hypothetical protein